MRSRAYHRRSLPLLLAGMGLALVACQSPPAHVELVQPQLSGAQRSLRLATAQAYWSPATAERSPAGTEARGAGTERVLAEFPLPGAATGRATYLLYLRIATATSTGPAAGTQELPVRGFFIQTRGANAGLALVTGGGARLLSASGLVHTWSVALTLDDGSRVGGVIGATRKDGELTIFETERRPADVQGLLMQPKEKGKR